MAASAACPIIIFFFLLLLSTTTSAHNITDIFSRFPDYSEYSNLLTQTKVADDINNRQTITVLVLNNSVVSSTLKSHPLDVLKTLLSIHVVLDYFDNTKLQNISQGSIITTTLYQTSGVAAQRNGFVNITKSKGEVFFSSATQGSKPTSEFTRSVKAEPYNISVVEISAAIDVPGVLNPPATSKDVNLTAVMEGAGSRKFADLIAKAKVLEEFDGVREKGLTVFAPSDDAWKKKGLPDWTRLSDDDLRTVLRYHATPSYLPIATLKGMKGGFLTLASVGGGKFSIVPEASGDFVLLKAGVDSARVVNTIVDSAPLTVFLVDSVLLPVELFGNSSTSPSPSPIQIPSPASPPSQHGSPPPAQPRTPPPAQPARPPASAPTLVPPGEGSPPAPPADVPATAPELGPAADEDGKKKKSGASRGRSSALFLGLVIAAVSASLF